MGSKNGKPVLRPEDKVALAKSSGHTEEMVQQEFDKFMKEYPDGKLNKASFNKMMSQALPKKEIDKVEKHVFRVYDTNGDGFIDFIEFMVLFHILSDGTPQDGKVTSEEFVKAVLGQEQFSKMLTLEIMNIFIDGR